MGLPIARAIVDAHGGRLWAVNNADRGVTFFFTLTRLGSGPAADPATLEAATGPARSWPAGAA
jgi:hypothetical protein